MAKTNIRGGQIADGSNGVDLAVDVTGTLPVVNGGTGAATQTLNAVLLGNGTSALQNVAPGAVGQVLRSDGTTFASANLDTMLGKVFDAQKIQRDTLLLASSDLAALNSVEIPAANSLEIPTTSSLEIIYVLPTLGPGGVLPAVQGGTGTIYGADPPASYPSSPAAWVSRNGGVSGSGFLPTRRTFYMNDPDSGVVGTTSVYEDTGQLVIYSAANPQMISKAGRMTFAPVSGSQFDYRWWQDPASSYVTRVGGRFTFDPTGGRNTTDGAVTFGIINDSVANASLTSFRMAVHLVVNPSYWQLDIGTNATGTLVFTNIDTKFFATRLVQDGVTSYRAEAWLDIANSKCTILLPDGTINTYTNANFAAYAGNWGFHEVSVTNGATDTIPGYTESWSDSSVVQYPPAPNVAGLGVADFEQFCTLTSPYTLTSTTAAQKIFNSTANGAVTLPVGTYFFDLFFTLSAMSATSGGLNFLFGATATIAGIQYFTEANKAVLATAAAPQCTAQTSNGVAGLVTATTATVAWARIQGKMRISAAGAIFPQLGLGVAAAAIVGADSYFRIWNAGSSTATSTIGNWS